VASEVAVKQAFFAPDSAAFEAFEFLEEKRKAEVTILELLKEPAKRAFGRGFPDIDAAATGRLEELFRCRSKVAHRGKLEYRDASGRIHTANQDTVRGWWHATDRLFEWLEGECGLIGVQTEGD